MRGINTTKITNTKEISPDGTTVKLRYFEDDLPLKAYEFTTALAKQCAGLQIIIKDLEIVYATLKLLRTFPLTMAKPEENHYTTFNTEDSQQLILTSLVTSSIVTYAKHFTNGKGLAPFISSDKIRKSLDDDLFLYHKKILHLRNNWIAHGGINDHEPAKTIILVDNERKGSYTYVHHVHFETLPIVNDIQTFIRLVKSTLNLIKKILNKRSSELWENEILKIPIETHAKNSSEYVTFLHKA